MRSMFQLAMASLAASFVVTASYAADDEIPVDKIPAAVVKTQKAKFPTAKIKKALKELDNGKTVYELEMTVDGQNVDVNFSEEGKILVVEREISADKLPKKVADGVAKTHPKGKITKVEEVTEGEEDEKAYEVTLDEDGKTLVVTFDDEGKIEEPEPAATANEIPLDKVPAAVLKTQKAKFPTAKIKKAIKEEDEGKTVYELEMTVDGRNVDANFSSEGKILSVEKEIAIEKLPKKVAEAVAKKYPKATIVLAEEMTEGDDDELDYEVTVKDGEKTIVIVLDADGKIDTIEEQK